MTRQRASKNRASVRRSRTEGNGFVHRRRNERNPRFSAEIHRTDGTVFVSVSNPNPIALDTPIEQFYSDGADLARQMIDDMSVEIPAEPQPRISSVDEIRVYRIDPDRKRYQIYTGAYTMDIDDRCKTYADLSGCKVELHNVDTYKVFESANPKPPVAPIPMGAKSNTVAVYNADTNETVWIGDRTVGFDCRCQRYAEKHNVSLRVVFEGGKRVQFFTPKSVRAEYGKQNSARKAVRS